MLNIDYETIKIRRPRISKDTSELIALMMRNEKNQNNSNIFKKIIAFHKFPIKKDPVHMLV
jgi:hypothetical protein